MNKYSIDNALKVLEHFGFTPPNLENQGFHRSVLGAQAFQWAVAKLGFISVRAEHAAEGDSAFVVWTGVGMEPMRGDLLDFACWSLQNSPFRGE